VRRPGRTRAFPQLSDAVSPTFPQPARVSTHGDAATHMSTNEHVLEFEGGVRAYPPSKENRYWRIRWEEAGRRRDTSARSRSEAVAKAAEVVERLGRGIATDLARATGAELVAHYLDPMRQPPRGQPWSERHRDEQVRYCGLYVLPEIGLIPCRRLTRVDFQCIMNRASTPWVAQHLRRCLTGIVNAGLDEGHLLPRQDVLRGVRWNPPDDDAVEPEVVGRAITEEEIPTTEAVHALAVATAHRRRPVWWRELEILLVAYSGLRWGEHARLPARDGKPVRGRIGASMASWSASTWPSPRPPCGRSSAATTSPRHRARTVRLRRSSFAPRPRRSWRVTTSPSRPSPSRRSTCSCSSTTPPARSSRSP
jgi:hypothetical protein